MTALEAHLKLLRLLPVRTHYWQPCAPYKVGRPKIEQTRRLMIAIKRLRDEGRSRAQIMEEIGCSVATVWRHCRSE